MRELSDTRSQSSVRDRVCSSLVTMTSCERCIAVVSMVAFGERMSLGKVGLGVLCGSARVAEGVVSVSGKGVVGVGGLERGMPPRPFRRTQMVVSARIPCARRVVDGAKTLPLDVRVYSDGSPGSVRRIVLVVSKGQRDSVYVSPCSERKISYVCSCGRYASASSSLQFSGELWGVCVDGEG